MQQILLSSPQLVANPNDETKKHKTLSSLPLSKYQPNPVIHKLLRRMLPQSLGKDCRSRGQEEAVDDSGNRMWSLWWFDCHNFCSLYRTCAQHGWR